MLQIVLKVGAEKIIKFSPNIIVTWKVTIHLYLLMFSDHAEADW